MSKGYEINVTSSPDFDQLFAEVKFVGKTVGAIISQELSKDRFEISVYSFDSKSKEKFYDSNKEPTLMVDLETFQQALSEAKSRLILLDSPVRR